MSKSVINSQKGSVLVAAVVFGIVLSIGGGSLLMVSSSTVNDEVKELAEARTLRAVESALMVGVNYVRIRDNYNALSQGDNTILSNFTLNGATATVVANWDGTEVTVTSTGTAPNLPYSKSISVKATVPAGNPGTFINFLNGQVGQVGGGGFNNVTIDGPFHSNQPIVFSSVSANFENSDLITVFNSTGTFNFTGPGKNDPFDLQLGSYEHFGEYGDGVLSNYDFGVYHHNLTESTDQGATLDARFGGTEFLHSQDFRFVDANQPADITLSAGTVEAGTDDAAVHRPTLVFNADGSADYYTWDNPGGVWTPTKDTTFLQSEINENLILIQGSDVNVTGVVDAEVTVMTEVGFSIFPVESIVMKGFTAVATDFANVDNSDNYGLELTNDNFLGLVSGANVHFPSRWIDPRDGVGATADLITGTQDVQASIFAAETAGTHMFNLDNNSNVNLSGNGSGTSYSNTWGLRFLGTRTLDAWFNYTSGGQNTSGRIGFFDDRRISEGLGTPPKLPIVVSQNNNGDEVLIFEYSDWTETNS